MIIERQIMSWNSKGHKVVCACVGFFMIAGLGACGFGSNNGVNRSAGAEGGVTASQGAAALKSDKDVELTLWTWQADSLKSTIDAFQSKYPHIKVKVTATGAAADHYTKFSNVIKANKDIPDMTMLEYDYLPQYATTKALLNINDKSIEQQMGSRYTKAAWADVHVAGGLYGFPMDQGPIVMYSRRDLLDQHGIAIPKTWDEFEQAGIALHKADPTRYMGYIDTADVRYMAAIMRQAKAPMWQVKGLENVTLDMTNKKVKEVVDFIQRLIDEDVLEPVASKTDEYNRGFAEGRWVTKIDGAWRSSTYEKQQQSMKGKVEITLPPAWGSSAADFKSATIGGSLFAVTTSCPKDKRAAAVAFLNWICSDPAAIKAGNSEGGIRFSPTKAYLDDATYQNQHNDYFNQNVNAIYMESSKKINTDWSILPFNTQYATSFKDIVVPEMKKGGKLASAFPKWQESLKTYAEGQGFKITDKK